MIKTDRLILTELTINDAEAMYKYSSDYENTKYMFHSKDTNIEETKKFITQSIDESRKIDKKFHCFGIYLNSVLIGDISVTFHGEYGELAWILNKEYQGNGYAYEAGSEYIKYIKDSYNLKYLIGRCDIKNTKSSNLMKKLGMIEKSIGPRIYTDGRAASQEIEYNLCL